MTGWERGKVERGPESLDIIFVHFHDIIDLFNYLN